MLSRRRFSSVMRLTKGLVNGLVVGMDPLSIAAGVVGIVTPALHGLRLLADDIRKIRDAPSVIRELSSHIATLNNSLVSLQAISEQLWEALGETVVAQTKSALTLCGDSCDKFRTSLASWTRHSENTNNLSWRDRAAIGFFKQGQIKSMTAQLQNNTITLASVVTIASLHSSLQQTTISTNIVSAISSQEAEIKTALATVETQLAEIGGTLGGLVLARNEGEEEVDRTVAIAQVAVEQTTLTGSHELLQQLLNNIQVAAIKAQEAQGVQVQFGDNNQGSQIGVSFGKVSNIFGSRK